MQSGTEREGREPKGGEVMKDWIDNLELSVRAENCLRNSGLKSYELIYIKYSELLKYRNVGRKTADEIFTKFCREIPKNPPEHIYARLSRKRLLFLVGYHEKRITESKHRIVLLKKYLSQHERTVGVE